MGQLRGFACEDSGSRLTYYLRYNTLLIAGRIGMPRSRHEPADQDPDDWEEADEHDAEHDYDPDDPETFPHGLYTDDGIPTVPCPHCGAEIIEDAERVRVARATYRRKMRRAIGAERG